MDDPLTLARRIELIDAAKRLRSARNIDGIVAAVRHSARIIAASDGICLIRREGNNVRYVAEDAIGPLWIGGIFPITECISGAAMLARAPVLIPDITQDSRVPLDIYRSTFVKRMAMFPVGVGDPVAAIGAYWQEPGPIEAATVELLAALARASGMAIEQIDFMESISRGNDVLRSAAVG